MRIDRALGVALIIMALAFTRAALAPTPFLGVRPDTMLSQLVRERAALLADPAHHGGQLDAMCAEKLRQLESEIAAELDRQAHAVVEW